MATRMKVLMSDYIAAPFFPEQYRDWRVAQEHRESRQNKRKGKK